MIKEVSKKVLKKINPNTTKEEEKWINVFNEVQYRTDVLFEALVSFYSLGLFFPSTCGNPRNGKSGEIATIALFLATPESSFINGQSIVADSGWTAF